MFPPSYSPLRPGSRRHRRRPDQPSTAIRIGPDAPRRSTSAYAGFRLQRVGGVVRTVVAPFPRIDPWFISPFFWNAFFPSRMSSPETSVSPSGPTPLRDGWRFLIRDPRAGPHDDAVEDERGGDHFAIVLRLSFMWLDLQDPKIRRDRRRSQFPTRRILVASFTNSRGKIPRMEVAS